MKHLDVGDGRLDKFVVANELAIHALLSNTAFRAAGDHRAMPRNAVDILEQQGGSQG